MLLQKREQEIISEIKKIQERHRLLKEQEAQYVKSFNELSGRLSEIQFLIKEGEKNGEANNKETELTS